VAPRTDWRVGLAVFAGVFLLYHLTFASVATGNGPRLLGIFERGDRDGMMLADWPLTGFILYSLTRVLAPSNGPLTPLTVVQTANAAAGAFGAAAFCQTIVLLGGGALLGALGALVLATSFASWYYVNGDTHHLALGAVLGLFYLLVRRHVSGRPYGYGFVAGLALLNAVAGLLLRGSVLFGIGAVAAGFVGRPWRRAVREAVVYVVAGAAGTAVFSLAVGMLLKGAREPRELLEWYALNVRLLWQPHEVYEPSGLLVSPLKLVKGQLSALLFGVQVIGDAIREPALLARAKVWALMATAAAGCAVLAALAADTWRRRALVRERCLLALVICAAWWVGFKAVLNWWFWPGAAKYHLQSVPPLIVLLLLGAIATRLAPDADRRRRARQAGLAAALLALVVVGNFWGAILPWYQYGRHRQAVAARARAEFRPDDFFVSTESGLDMIVSRDDNHVDVKDVLRRTSGDEGFRLVRATIDAQIARGRRVFVYNLVPSPYTLFQINHALVRRPGERFTTADFEAVVADLRQRYALRAALTYWEEGKEPLYLFGERFETVWQVVPRS
jgi:hypothetical protein